MEAGSAIVLAIVLLAGGGAAGAAMLTEVGQWHGNGMMGGDYEDCPCRDGGDECPRGAEVDPEECDQYEAGDCPYHDDGGYQPRGAMVDRSAGICSNPCPLTY